MEESWEIITAPDKYLRARASPFVWPYSQRVGCAFIISEESLTTYALQNLFTPEKNAKQKKNKDKKNKGKMLFHFYFRKKFPLFPLRNGNTFSASSIL